MNRKLSAFRILALTLVWCAACATTSKGTGDETHFGTCKVDDDCRAAGAAYRCEQGLCKNLSAMSSATGGTPTTVPSSLAAGGTTSQATPVPSGRAGSGLAVDASSSDAGRSVRVSDVAEAGDARGAVSTADAGPRTDAGPTGTVLAELAGEISAACMDGDSLYFAIEGGSLVITPALWRLAKSGGTPVPVTSPVPTYVEGMATDGEFVYFTDLSGGTINRVPITGGTPQVIAQGQTRPWGITVDATTIYWANQGTDQAGVPTNDGASIVSLSKGGGAPATLAPAEQTPTSIVPDGAGGILWLNGGWNGTSGAIRHLDAQHGSPTSLAVTLLELTSGPVVAGDRVYWSTASGFSSAATISSVALAGGTVSTTLVLGSPNSGGAAPLASDDEALYFAAGDSGLNDGSVRKMELSSRAQSLVSGPEPVRPGMAVRDTVEQLLLDAERVYVFEYWGEYTSGAHSRVRALPR